MSAATALALLVNGGVMVGLPIVLAIAWQRYSGARWALFAGGVGAFVASQVVHLPLLYGLTWAFSAGVLPRPPASWVHFDAITLGFFAAACEEPARALLFGRVFPRDREPRSGVMAGIGHGGIEAIVLGALVLLTLVNMVASRDLTAAQMAALGVPADEAGLAVEQIRAYWATPWYEAVLGAVERVLAVTFHVAASVLVAASVRERRVLPFVIAFGAHWAMDSGVVIAAQRMGAWETELALAAAVLPFGGIVLWWGLRGRVARPASASASG